MIINNRVTTVIVMDQLCIDDWTRIKEEKQCNKEGIIVMTNIRELLHNNSIVKLEFTYTIGATKRIQIVSEFTDIRPNDIILDMVTSYLI
jgi:hypothetical protein